MSEHHHPTAEHAVFSYGTLRQSAVQLATFGRLLEGEDDAVVGFRLDELPISNPDVVALSGAATHPVLVPTGEVADVVAGSVFWLTSTELAASDAYEAADYQRTLAPLASGGDAWVYLARIR